MEAARSVTWFSSPETTPRATCPTEVFVRFAATHFRPPARFLEIGSGCGINLTWLRQQGYVALGVDSNPQAIADVHLPIADYLAESEAKFDCIFDVLTLCHIEEPPYKAIHAALNPDGRFFSIAPALDTEWDISRKGFTRLSSEESLRHELRDFSEVLIGPYCYPHRGRNHTHWIVEAK